MDYYVGIDLGTSSVKVLLLSGEGEVVSSVTREYPLYFPHSGWSEQNPEDWYNQTIDALRELLRASQSIGKCHITTHSYVYDKHLRKTGMMLFLIF